MLLPSKNQPAKIENTVTAPDRGQPHSEVPWGLAQLRVTAHCQRTLVIATGPVCYKIRAYKSEIAKVTVSWVATPLVSETCGYPIRSILV